MTNPRSHSALAFAGALLLTLAALGGCAADDDVIEPGERRVDAVTGCPDLGGRYAVVPPDPKTGVRFDGSALGADAAAGPGLGAPADGETVEVVGHGTHAVEMRFAYPHARVMQSLEQIRQYERPRYAEWFALMQPETRDRYVARHGEAARQRRLAELGPATGRSVRFERNRDYTCEDGWLLFPRPQQGPLRATVDRHGALAFESQELSTYEVVVWCGDGCKGFPIPTGRYTGTTRWGADPSSREWNADDMAGRFDFLRPVDVVEAEQRGFAENNQRHAEAIYATPEQVREALAPLLPDGVAIADIRITTLPFKGPRVRVLAVPADAAMPDQQQRERLEWFLAALREGDPSTIEDSEVVKRGIVGNGAVRHEYEIYLDTHPSVQPRRADGPQAVAYAPPPPLPAPLQERPEGFATLAALEERLAAHLAAGCRIASLRYAGGAVVLTGDAVSMQCVSETMRALDAAVPADADVGGPRIELMQIAAVDGGYTFEIRLPGSALTKA